MFIPPFHPLFCRRTNTKQKTYIKYSKCKYNIITSAHTRKVLVVEPAVTCHPSVFTNNPHPQTENERARMLRNPRILKAAKPTRISSQEAECAMWWARVLKSKCSCGGLPVGTPSFYKCMRMRVCFFSINNWTTPKWTLHVILIWPGMFASPCW